MYDADECKPWEERIPLIGSSKIARDVVQKIVKRFADSGFNDLDLLLELPFTKDKVTRPGQTKSISRQQFAEFLLHDFRGQHLTESEVTIFVQTNQVLKNKELFTKEDLK